MILLKDHYFLANVSSLNGNKWRKAVNNLSRKPKVLLVEDEPIIQKVHCLMLEKIGCDVDIASNGCEALKKSKNTYDIIFMDIGLPDITGIEVSHHLRAREHKHHLSATPIIAVTAFCLDDVREDCLRVGVNQLLAKPIDMKVFKQIILSTIGGTF